MPVEEVTPDATQLDSPTNAQTFALEDGRKLGYAFYGAQSNENPPHTHLLYFHGMPGSRLEAADLHVAALSLGIQIISVDRPGVGLSSPKSGRSVLDHADEVVILLQKLGVANIYLLGTSAGAAYALACAYRWPKEQVRGLGLVAPWILGVDGVGLRRRILNFITVWLPIFAIEKVVYYTLAAPSCHPDPAVLYELFVQGFQASEFAKERDLFHRPEKIHFMVQNEREAFRQGAAGVAQECKLMALRWGFDFQKLRPDLVVNIFLGERDAHIPLEMGRNAVNLFPSAQPTEYAEETHYTLIANQGLDILRRTCEAGFLATT